MPSTLEAFYCLRGNFFSLCLMEKMARLSRRWSLRTLARDPAAVYCIHPCIRST